MWAERPGLERLAEYKITGLANKQYKKDVPAEAKPLLPNMELDSKTVVYKGHQVKLSPVAWAILQLSISQLDKYVIPRFKSVLARRPRGVDKFPSLVALQKRQLSETPESMDARPSKTRRLEQRVMQLEYQVFLRVLFGLHSIFLVACISFSRNRGKGSSKDHDIL